MSPQQSDRHRSYSFSGLSTFPRFLFSDFVSFSAFTEAFFLFPNHVSNYFTITYICFFHGLSVSAVFFSFSTASYTLHFTSLQTTLTLCPSLCPALLKVTSGFSFQKLKINPHKNAPLQIKRLSPAFVVFPLLILDI